MKPDTSSPASRGTVMIGFAKSSEVIPSIFVTLLIFGFYMAHYSWSTGFFTGAFTSVLASLFFASVLFTIATTATKSLTPRRDIVALVEFIGAGLLALTAFWFYVAFPLDFAHVADVVPMQLQFLLTWMTNDIGRILVVLVLIAALIALAVDAVRLTLRVSERQYCRQERY